MVDKGSLLKGTYLQLSFLTNKEQEWLYELAPHPITENLAKMLRAENTTLTKERIKTLLEAQTGKAQTNPQPNTPWLKWIMH